VSDPSDGPTLATPLPDESGPLPSQTPARTLLAGRYELEGLLGVGGMGAVYRARDLQLDEHVALKILSRELAASPGMLARFRQEVKLARKVTHRNVARTYDLGEADGTHFLTMELVEGESLDALLSRERPLSVARVVDLVLPVCEGLAAAHAAGVVHRDLKPDNVLIAKDGRVLLTDFGVARALEGGSKRTMGMPVGTPAYMAPEQVEASADIDARADQYALGVMLFEMLTGSLPFVGPSPYAVAAQRLVQPPPDPRSLRPDLPAQVAETVLRCMARKPEDRFPSVLELATRLGSATLPGNADPLGASVQARASQRTHTSAKTVAVLPLRNHGEDADAWLAEGLSDDVVDALSVVAGLRVRPRGVVAATRIEGRDPCDVGRELGVQVIVEGSVRVLGEKVRISTRVLSVADGFQLWAKRFDVDRAEVLRVGDAIAQAISDALVVERAPEARPGTDADAIEAYLRGRHEYLRFTAEHNARACEHLATAAARFPDDPTILSAHAMSLSRLLFFDSSRAILERARATAERAMKLAPTRGEPHVAACGVAVHAGRFAEGAAQLARALRLAPDLADAHEYAARLFSELGEMERMRLHAELAMRLEPRMAYLRVLFARQAAFARRWDEVDELYARPLDRGTFSLFWMARARFLLWRRDRALAARVLAEFEAADPAAKSSFLSRNVTELLYVASTGDLRAAARAHLEERIWASEPRAAGLFVQLLSELAGNVGQDELVLSTLRANHQTLFDVSWLDQCPALDGVRARPEFAAVRERVAETANAVRTALAG
jgi:serine/threonine-protein kinase